MSAPVASNFVTNASTASFGRNGVIDSFAGLPALLSESADQ